MAAVVVLLGLGVSGMAQQNNNSFKVKHNPDKAAKKTGAVVPRSGAKATSNANAKDLKNLEHQTAKTSAPPRTHAKKSAQLKPVKDKSNPPMNFGAKGGGKSAGLSKQPSNPYKGRLKQKHSR